MAVVCALSLGSAEEAGAVRITEFPLPVPGSAPLGITAGPDGNMWFTEVAGSRIGRITPAGSITDWSTGSGISTNSRPWAIAAGSDGNVWFTEEVGRVGRITPAAVATEFTAGISPNAGPRGIATGPDGNVWFTEDGGNRIGRITPAGAVTEFSLGITAGSRPLSITAGPDGNLWFTSMGTNRIGRITPGGVVTEYSAGIGQGARVHDITAGKDGNLWFTEADLDRIGRITPAGVVTEFSAGITPNSRPRGITAGPDGNVWFAEEQGNRLARITPAGVVTEFSAGISGTFGIAGVAAGPTGDLWYTGASTNRIGRVSLDPLVVTGAAQQIGSTSASASATITPLGSSTSYAFEYGRSTSYGSTTGSRTLAPGVAPVAVATTLGGLQPGRLHHYRVVASSAAGTSFGQDRTFTTTASGDANLAPVGSVDRTGPRVRIVERTLRLGRNRRVQITLACPLAEALGCRGTVRLDAISRRGRPAGKKLMPMGSARFRIGGGQTRRVPVTLSQKAWVLVRQTGRVRARARVSAQDASGNRARTVAAITVRSRRR